MIHLSYTNSRTVLRRISTALLSLSLLCTASSLIAQDVPLVSGAVAFQTRTDGGNTSYLPTLNPLLAAPVGKHLLFESRATLLEDFFPQGQGKGYTTRHFIGLSFAQADYIVNSHLTVVGGYFLTPFGTYNERLTPLWIQNLQDGPLLNGIGTMGSGSGLGGEIRGNAISREKFKVTYTAYISAGSTNEQLSAERSTGGQTSIYFPAAGLEIGASYGRLLERNQTNSVGTHLWWAPPNTPLHIRSEYAHGDHAQGYWIEGAYRLSQIHGPESPIGRLEPIVRMQQTFRNSPDPTDGLPAVDTQRVDFGLDYHLPHEVRINTSYGRQFSSTSTVNIWETTILYRFLFPAWRGKR